jgi:hypothetical protein
MVNQSNLEQIVEKIAQEVFGKMFPNAAEMNKEETAESVMSVLELVGYIINNFMIEVNKVMESAAEEVVNEKETPKIFVP